MRLVADENMVGLDALPSGIDVRAVAGRAIDAAMLRDADALWVRSVTKVDAALVDGAALRFVGSATAGLEHVDQNALAARGIAFAAAPGANAMAVVEYVVAALAHSVEPWEILEGGGSLGIVGYGHVGRRLAAFARAMGWQLVISDPPLAASPSTLPSEAATLNEVLGCDVISLHCALHDLPPWPSRHLIDGDALARLAPGTWLINASRGGVLDTAALRLHLARDRSARCVLDVWEREPQISADLLAQPAIRLATPHIAGYSWDAKWAATRLLLASMASLGLVDVPEKPVSAPSVTLPPGWPASAQGPNELMAPVYDIAADDAALRRALHVGDQALRAAAFDRLRRDYPLRREVSRLLESCDDQELGRLPASVGRAVRALGDAASVVFRPAMA